jgi:hypothetical protein
MAVREPRDRDGKYVHRDLCRDRRRFGRRRKHVRERLRRKHLGIGFW